MPVFKTFFKVLYKRKTSLIMYIVIYLVLAVFFSNVMQEKEEGVFSNVALNIALENHDQGNLGKAFAEYLEERHTLQEMPQDREALQDAMYYQSIDYVLVIPEDFTERMSAEGADEKSAPNGILEGTAVPGSSSAYFMENEIGHYLNTVSMYLAAGYDMEEAAQESAKNLKHKPQVSFLEKQGQQLPSAYYSVQYLPYVFVVIMILGVGAVMKTYKNKDLAARNQCSAMPFLSQNLQLILGCMVYILLVCLIFIVMICITDHEYMFSLKGALSAANAFLFSFCALSVAWFSVQLVRSVSELNIMSNVFGLGFSFLGGVFVPMEMMGDTAKALGRFVPSYWYVAANTRIQELESLSGAYPVYQAFLLVILFTAAFFAAGLLVSKIKVRE